MWFKTPTVQCAETGFRGSWLTSVNPSAEHTDPVQHWNILLLRTQAVTCRCNDAKMS
jgi:hypothetical protein